MQGTDQQPRCRAHLQKAQGCGTLAPQFTKAYSEIFGEEFVDVPEQNTITFKLEWSDQGKKKTSASAEAQNPN
jgi:hypothetical protein